jgi:glycine/D-amino acid oxidase-like deaminating enzyme
MAGHTTRRGRVAAPHVVIATNGYTDDLWPGLRRSIVPVFGAIAATAPLPAAVAREILPGRSVLYESSAITVYYRVDSAQRLLIGGRGPMRDIESTTEIPHLLKYAVRLWPALNGIRWTHAWGGRLAMTRDAYPHVHEPARGVSMSLGYNGRGVAMATTMGAVLAHSRARRRRRYADHRHPANPHASAVAAGRPGGDRARTALRCPRPLTAGVYLAS